MKILAANRSASIALVLGECRRAFGRKVLVQLASSDLASQQSRDLRLRSLVWPELDRRPTTPLIHGIHVTVEDLRSQLGARARAFGFR
jgi:UDP-glucose 4-epimerase